MQFSFFKTLLLKKGFSCTHTHTRAVYKEPPLLCSICIDHGQEGRKLGGGARGGGGYLHHPDPSPPLHPRAGPEHQHRPSGDRAAHLNPPGQREVRRGGRKQLTLTHLWSLLFISFSFSLLFLSFHLMVRFIQFHVIFHLFLVSFPFRSFSVSSDVQVVTGTITYPQICTFSQFFLSYATCPPDVT